MSVQQRLNIQHQNLKVSELYNRLSYSHVLMCVKLNEPLCICKKQWCIRAYEFSQSDQPVVDLYSINTTEIHSI